MTSETNTAKTTWHLFELAAARYRADPTNHRFTDLSSKLSSSERASLTEIAYEVASKASFAGPPLTHLVRALFVEDRITEAHYFCQRWIADEPTEYEAHRLAVLIACRRGDFVSCRISFRTLNETNAEPGILWALETIIYLTFFEGRDAAITARLAIAKLPNDPLVLMASCDAAYRANDAQLLIELFMIDPKLVVEGRREPRARIMLRQHLLELLRSQIRMRT